MSATSTTPRASPKPSPVRRVAIQPKPASAANVDSKPVSAMSSFKATVATKPAAVKTSTQRTRAPAKPMAVCSSAVVELVYGDHFLLTEYLLKIDAGELTSVMPLQGIHRKRYTCPIAFDNGLYYRRSSKGELSENPINSRNSSIIRIRDDTFVISSHKYTNDRTEETSRVCVVKKDRIYVLRYATPLFGYTLSATRIDQYTIDGEYLCSMRRAETFYK